jgi:hypothetical protein
LVDEHERQAKVARLEHSALEERLLPVPEQEEPPVINLMDALRRSIARTGGNGAEQPRRAKSTSGNDAPRHGRRLGPIYSDGRMYYTNLEQEGTEATE